VHLIFELNLHTFAPTDLLIFLLAQSVQHVELKFEPLLQFVLRLLK